MVERGIPTQQPLQFIQTQKDLTPEIFKTYFIPYTTYNKELFVKTLKMVSVGDYYKAIEKRSTLYFKIISMYKVPLNIDELIQLNFSHEIVELICNQIPQKTPNDLNLDYLSFWYFYLALGTRHDVFFTIEVIIYFHRLFLFPPYVLCQLLPPVKYIQEIPPRVVIDIFQYEHFACLLPLHLYQVLHGNLIVPVTLLVQPCLVHFAKNFTKNSGLCERLSFDFFPLSLVDPLIHLLPRKEAPKFQTASQKRTINDVLQNLPPCIYLIHAKASHGEQMKYDARRQIVVFFKNAGVELNEAMEYMRARLDVMRGKEKKQLEYFVEHCYGMRGNHIDFKPDLCKNLMSQSMCIGGLHGCILCKRQYNNEFRKKSLESYLEYIGVEMSDKEMVELLQMEECSACAQLLNMSSRGVGDIEEINSPNLFCEYKISKKV
ncbi:hypothetical protein EIN_388080 [Entamoeba invadens IP1]|uniref:DNA primase large subunit C-terminal domain-containing protein n=1 Tax=Entamoeba invadens IP1 TaxID=370355 RepID=A0A0A1UFX7_ENTIV|nr:hypothetical protein EIN_388080 [Entamoeba invadens IP1]ELP92014.1 hypothetical protein EIN_388080 [Entamoeba invadens IP1]|eukprot:XP_004258785.1 hypothetical protein EIN_388080 [Entamoeba invadens IP1]